ncbi:MAG: ATP-dependent metallopeptidase FtsH/Yme1/Tma family protein, partial [Elusimicrobiales bacterium]|nr:ATP-dependent metallopeptidase FtsH/Yme1/Tma family protein [Elusimicrobiales bacterium]
MKRNTTFKQIIIWFLFFILLGGIYSSLIINEREKEVPYSYFRLKLKEKQVKKVYISNDTVRGEILENGKVIKFRTIPLSDPQLVKDMEEAGVEVFQGVPDRSWITTILFNIGWIILFILAWWFIFFRQANVAGKQAMNFAKSRARQVDPKKNRVTFKDVAGCDEAKEELLDIV